jgi:hypothetical protein
MKIRRLAFRWATVLAAAALHAESASAAQISLVGTPEYHGQNLQLTTTTSRISLSDSFDQYSDTQWSIASVTDTPSGAVAVTYRFTTFGPWDLYGALADIPFQILEESGDSSPQAVTVDYWGSSFHRASWELSCCRSEPPEVAILGPHNPEPRYYGQSGGVYEQFAGSHTLLTNTTYFLSYSNFQTIEGTPAPGALPGGFASRHEFNTWVSQRGTSGTISASSFGFLNYNLEVRTSAVPEPHSFSLLFFGITALVLARRRTQAKRRLT